MIHKRTKLNKKTLSRKSWWSQPGRWDKQSAVRRICGRLKMLARNERAKECREYSDSDLACVKCCESDGYWILIRVWNHESYTVLLYNI